MAISRETTGMDFEARGGGGAIVRAGVVAGIIGGMLMAMIMMAATASSGMGLLAPLRLIAATFYGKEAMAGGGPLLVGLIVHMMNSMVFGLVFAWFAARRLAGLPALMAGVAFGVAIWAVMTFGGLPALNPLMREAVTTMPLAWFIAHVAFGMGVGSAPGLWRRIAAP